MRIVRIAKDILLVSGGGLLIVIATAVTIPIATEIWWTFDRPRHIRMIRSSWEGRKRRLKHNLGLLPRRR